VIESELADLDIATLLNIFAPEQSANFTGKLSGKLNIAGPTLNERGEATTALLRGGLTLSGVELQVQGNEIKVQTPLTIALSGAQVSVANTRLSGQGIDLTLGGEVGLEEQARMNFALNGTLTLAALPPLSPDLRLDGVVTINNARLTGTVETPSLSGEILLSQLGLTSPDAPAAVEAGNGRITLAGDKATLENFQARINDGALEASGVLTLAQLRASEWRANLKTTNVDFIYQEVRATINGTFTLTGNPQGQTLSGQATVSDAEYTGQIDLDGVFAGRSIAPGFSRFSAPGIGGRDPGLPPINLDVRVEARDSVVIRDDELSTLGSAFLSLSGPLTDPNIGGNVSADGGTVRFRGQRYEITAATLALSGGSEPPRLNLQAEGNTSGHRVYIGFVGPVNQLELQLRTEPALTREEILSLIATGRTESRAGGGSELFYTGVDTAASLLSAQITKPLERQLGIIGVNRLQIDPVFRPNTNPAARATIGGILARSLYYSFASDLASEGDRTASLEYSFSNNFSTIITYTQGGTASGGGRSNNNDFALEIRGRKSFSLGFRQPPALAQANVGAEPAAPQPAVRPKLLAADVHVNPVPGVSLDRRQLQELLPIKTQGYSRSLARLGERRLLNYLQEKGYFFAEVGSRCEPVNCSGENLRVYYEVEPGERYQLTNLRFEATPEGTQRKLADELAGALTSDLQSQPATALSGVPFVRDLPFIGGLKRGITSNERVKADVETLRRALVDRGYRNARVNSRYAVTEENGLVVVFNLEPGAQSSVVEVQTRGNTLLTAGELREAVPLKDGETFSLTRSLLGAQAIKQLYSERGYLAANAELEVVDLADDRVRLVYNVSEGLQAVVGQIAVAGTTKTRENWVRRYYAFGKGDVLTPANIRQTQRDLYATGAFREVGLRVEPVNADTGEHRVTINLTEAKPLLFVYGLGYSTDDGARGLLQLTNTNLWGTLDAATLRLRASGREQFAQFSFTDLRPFGTRLPTTFSVFYNRNGDLRPFVRERQLEFDPAKQTTRRIDTPNASSYGLQRFAAFIQTERKLNEHTSLRFRYNLERANLFNFEQNFPETAVTRNERVVRLGIFSVGISHDTRDNLLNPTRGQLVSADHSVATRLLGGNQSYNKFFATYQRYYSFAPETPVLKNSTLAVAARLGLAALFRLIDQNGNGQIELAEARLPISERFFSGGATTLRGFRFETAGPQLVLPGINCAMPLDPLQARKCARPSDQTQPYPLAFLPTLVPLGGNALSIVNFELRYPLTQRIRLVPFYDAGNVYSLVKDLRLRNMANTVGLGLHFNTPLGPIGIDYGFLLNPQSYSAGADAILRQPRGVLHIRFGQTF
jgi:outer membrane protein insertion porin family